MSNRALQRKHGVGFRTVTAALESAWPKERKQPPKRGSRLDAYRVVIDDWLRSDLDAPRKQRHTAKRIFDRLLDEHDGAGVVSYWMVREYVATRRREIRVEVGREPANAFIPQEHLPGREAEVDFGDVAIRLCGELVTCALFSLRLSCSGKAVHRVSASAGQEAFFEGHVHAFNVLGGVPTGKIRYDNLKAAVASVIGFSRQRVEADRWTAVRSHYGIEAFYCQPGIQGAHEKGGVEGQIGWFRRNHLVPIPEVDSLDELNAMVANTWGNAPYLKDRFVYFDEKWAPRFTDPKVKEGFKLWADLMKLSAPGVTSFDWYEATTQFAQGKAATFGPDASLFASIFLDPAQSTVADKVGFKALPAASADGAHTAMWSWGLSIPEKSAKKEAAWLFVQWATSPWVTEQVSLKTLASSRQSTWKNPEYQAKLPEGFGNAVGESLAIAQPSIMYLTSADQVVQNMLDALQAIYGGTPVDEAMQKLQDQATEIVKQAGLYKP